MHSAIHSRLLNRLKTPLGGVIITVISIQAHNIRAERSCHSFYNSTYFDTSALFQGTIDDARGGKNGEIYHQWDNPDCMIKAGIEWINNRDRIEDPGSLQLKRSFLNYYGYSSPVSGNVKSGSAGLSMEIYDSLFYISAGSRFLPDQGSRSSFLTPPYEISRIPEIPSRRESKSIFLGAGWFNFYTGLFLIENHPGYGIFITHPFFSFYYHPEAKLSALSSFSQVDYKKIKQKTVVDLIYREGLLEGFGKLTLSSEEFNLKLSGDRDSKKDYEDYNTRNFFSNRRGKSGRGGLSLQYRKILYLDFSGEDRGIDGFRQGSVSGRIYLSDFIFIESRIREYRRAIYKPTSFVKKFNGIAGFVGYENNFFFLKVALEKRTDNTWTWEGSLAFSEKSWEFEMGWIQMVRGDPMKSFLYISVPEQRDSGLWFGKDQKSMYRLRIQSHFLFLSVSVAPGEIRPYLILQAGLQL